MLTIQSRHNGATSYSFPLTSWARQTLPILSKPIKPKLLDLSHSPSQSYSPHKFTHHVESKYNKKEEMTACSPVFHLSLKLKEYQGIRSTRWNHLPSKVFLPNFKEENTIRAAKISEILKQFLECSNNIPLALNKDKPSLEAKIFALADEIFALYSINFHIMSSPAVDSLLDVKALRCHSELIKGLRVLVPELCKFPYSFYTRIDLISISFCGTVIILQKGKRALVEKRLMSGMFPLETLATPEKIVKHFYKVLFYHIKAVSISCEKKTLCTNSITTKPTPVSYKSLDFIDGSFIKHKYTQGLGEQSKLLQSLMTDPYKILHCSSEMLCSKGEILKQLLEKLDPDGINEQFWARNEFQNSNKSLDLSEIMIANLNTSCVKTYWFPQ